MGFKIDRTRPFGAIIIGRAGIDLYPIPDGTKIDAAERFVADLGGSAGNIAVALARQSVKSAMLSPLSDDPIGRFVRATLIRYGVDTSRCRAIGGDHRTSMAFAETRANDCEVVIYRNGAADLELSMEDIDATFIASASLLIVTGTALAIEPSRSAVMGALIAARAAQTFTVLDIDHRRYSWTSEREAGSVYAHAARFCDAVVGNEDEFGLIADRGGAFAVAEKFLNGGCALVVVKRGAEGSVTFTPEARFETDTFAATVMKPFGAGDAFMGSLIASLLHGQPIATAVTRGTAAAAHVVSRRGCASAMPTAAEVEALICYMPATDRK
jgi:5-dehydro-2-deoxygluconokinase